MEKEALVKALEKQVQLISKCSENCVAEADAQGLAALTEALRKLTDTVDLFCN
nr:MAG TPA: hypothetical protein [Bacteriophage sp.]